MANIKYYDCDLNNDEEIPLRASVYNLQNDTILEKPDDYQMSIIKFSVNSQLIPIFFPVIPNPAFPLTTDKSITLFYAGSYYRAFIQVQQTDIDNGIFFYQTYLNYLNAASKAAYDLLIAAHGTTDTFVEPLFFLNPNNSLISMYVSDGYETGAPNSVGIGINRDLFQLIDLPSVLGNAFPDITGYEYIIQVDNSALILPSIIPPETRAGYPSILSKPAYAASQFLQINQEFRSLEKWNSITSILFTSSLPIQLEYFPAKNGSNQNYTLQQSSLSIVSDFNLNLDSVQPTRSQINYVPSGEYRMIDLKQGSPPIKALDLNCFYKTRDGIIRPLYLPKNGNLSVKVLFRRKFFI